MHLVRLKCVRWVLRWSKIVVFPRVNWKQHCIHVIIIINIIQNGSYICFKENLIGGSNALLGSYEDTSSLSSSSSSDWWLIIKYETFPGEGHILGGGSSSSNRRNTSDLQLSDRLISSTNTDGYVLLPRGEETCIHETIKDTVLAVCPTEHYQFHRFEECYKCLAKKSRIKCRFGVQVIQLVLLHHSQASDELWTSIRKILFYSPNVSYGISMVIKFTNQEKKWNAKDIRNKICNIDNT